MNFTALSLKDLLEARDLYHVHLTKKENVIATAIGRYRIRKKDKDAKRAEAVDVDRVRNTVAKTSARTLANSEVKPWSWPCILVFVKEWAQKSDFAARPDLMVPYYLYLPDGRMVPTCVVLAERNNAPLPPLTGLQFPPHLIGGGYPMLTSVQGQQRVGSIGCLVSDGLAVYALTNRHVTGLPGQEIKSVIGGREMLLGKSATSQLARKPFDEVFDGWPGTNTFVNIDAGLIRVEDLSHWTAQVYGIGELDEMVDLYSDTLSLDWLGRPVRAFGAASGQLRGVIHGFFYRYRAMGGEESVAELLIGPEDETKPLPSVPGDSGTLWFVSTPDDGKRASGKRAERWQPLAMQWGGHRFLGASDGSYQFVLATSLSTICRELEIEIVRDWNIGHSEYWGKVGHYHVAAKACSLFSSGNVKTFFKKNLDRISFAESAIADGTVKKFKSHDFVPLADVADLVWRTTRKSDANNHFADMDAESEMFGGKTLLEVCKDPKQITPAVWIQFYKSIKAHSHGALPFRIWQGFDEMVAALNKPQPDITRFLCIAGTMAHYVGDACQPLHVSQYHHGTNSAEHDVHEVYETRMLDQNAAELVAGVNAAIGSRRAKIVAKNGYEAAIATVGLMRKTFTTLKPLDIVKLYNDRTGNERVPYMWSKLKNKTCAVIADGALCLASLWLSAWEAGGGKSIPASKIVAVDTDDLVTLYNTPSFYLSQSLTKMAPTLKGGPA